MLEVQFYVIDINSVSVGWRSVAFRKSPNNLKNHPIRAVLPAGLS